MDTPRPSQNGLVAAILFAAVVVSGSLGFLGYQMTSSEAVSADLLSRDQLMKTLEQMDKNELAEIFEELSTRVTASYDVLVDDDPFMGDENAPVTIVEWSDYQCPFCQRHFNQTLGQIKKDYIDTGKVKYVFRDFPLSFHADAVAAATAADCAREQGGNEAYFAMNKKLFEGSQSSLNESTFTRYATDIDLDLSAFKTCLQEDAYQDEIQADIAAGASFGINGTPGFVVTDGESSKLISGAQPYAVFKSEIEKRLK